MSGSEPNKRILCGVLALTAPLWGGFGVHKFILGKIGPGVVHLLLTFIGVGIVISVIEGVIYLLKSEDEFAAIYQRGERAWL